MTDSTAGLELSPEEEALLLETLGAAVDEAGNIDYSKLDLNTLDLEKLIQESTIQHDAKHGTLSQ